MHSNSLSLKSKIGYGIGHFYNDLCANMWFSYILLYMTKIIGLTPLNSGILLAIGQIADAFATLIIGSSLLMGSIL
ncbi:hypothetical protein HZS_5677 [Henneguya salminicola]|nr:hypothetical protein HZS_5677 [Henneguya salminicola]